MKVHRRQLAGHLGVHRDRRRGDHRADTLHRQRHRLLDDRSGGDRYDLRIGTATAAAPMGGVDGAASPPQQAAAATALASARAPRRDRTLIRIIQIAGRRSGSSARRLARRIEAEEHPGGRREAERDGHGVGRHGAVGQPMPQRQRRDASPKPSAMPMTPPIRLSTTASTRNCSSTSRAARADRHAQADLAGPLGHRHQHDVHDADAADQQRDAGDAGEQRRHRLRRCGALTLGDLVDASRTVKSSGRRPGCLC